MLTTAFGTEEEARVVRVEEEEREGAEEGRVLCESEHLYDLGRGGVVVVVVRSGAARLSITPSIDG